MKRVWDPATLKAVWWEGPAPKSGDGLRNGRGRVYLILEVRPMPKYTRLKCVIVPDDSHVEGTMFYWSTKRRGSARN